MKGARVLREEHHGFLLLDKPLGWTSNRALQEAKRCLNARKAGHTGSLDPLATGLLPLCFGDATRLAQFLLDADKGYEAEFRLGEETDTYDSEGSVTASYPVDVTAELVEQALERFRGAIEQVPPMFSAIKREGRPLYERARAGEVVEREARPVTVYEFALLGLAGDRLRTRIQCSKGTYVRGLAHDLGRQLGCGAHVTALRRTRVGAFSIENAVTLDQLAQARAAGQAETLLIPADRALLHLPSLSLDATGAGRLGQGQAVPVTGGADGWVRVYGEGERFMGVGWQAAGVVHPKRLVSI